MFDSMPVSTLIAGMFLTGCANSLLSKWQDVICVENCEPGSINPRLNFEQPVYQTLNMFMGEFLCVIPLIWAWATTATKTKPSPMSRLLGQSNGYDPVSAESPDSEEDDEEVTEIDGVIVRKMRGAAVLWMWFPAFCDICGTTLMNVGLILTPVSIYQMSRGALVIWVGALSVIFLRRHLWLYQWASLVIVTIGVALVGLAGKLIKEATLPDTDPISATAMLVRIATSTRAEDDPAKVELGVLLILFAQIFTASQYVIEEKILSHYHVEPLAAVTLEGMFGGLTTLIGMPILHMLFSRRSPYFDVPRGWHQLINHPQVMWVSFAIALSIGAFNFFGLSVTSRVSATTRSTIDTCRTLGIWIVSLSIGWERLVWPTSLLQVAGFAMLVYGTFVFNGLLEPILFKPGRIQLPEEDEEAVQGYDVVAPAGEAVAAGADPTFGEPGNRS